MSLPPSASIPPRIPVKAVCDPLTIGSYLNPTAPWVGIDQDGRVTSLSLGRFESLLKGYVGGRTAGCSVLLGGDRGAGRTSMVLKAIERLRWRRPHLASYDPSKSLHFPRPLPVRIHGPSLLGDSRTGAPVSRAAFRMFAEAIHVALCEEYGEMFRGKAGDDVDLQERAAQFRMELDCGPKSGRLREMWATFSSSSNGLEPILPGAGASVVPPDQVHRELVAFDTSLRMCREINVHRDDERSQQRNSRSISEGGAMDWEETVHPQARMTSKVDQDTTTWMRAFFKFMLHGGGRALNPLIGFVVGAVVFVAYIKEVGDIPAGLLLAFVAGFVTTLLSNVMSAAHDAGKMMSDDSFASLERALPILLHRIEAAGLFPVIIVDELDRIDGVEGGSTEKGANLRGRIARLTTDLKYFAADQAFICFLAPRRFYEDVHHNPAHHDGWGGELDSFFTDRILVSHHPSELLQYLKERLSVH